MVVFTQGLTWTVGLGGELRRSQLAFRNDWPTVFTPISAPALKKLGDRCWDPVAGTETEGTAGVSVEEGTGTGTGTGMDIDVGGVGCEGVVALP